MGEYKSKSTSIITDNGKSYIEISGSKMRFVGLKLDIALNSIPCITVFFPPNLGIFDGDEKTEISSPGLDEIQKSLDKLNGFIQNATPVSIHVELSDSSEIAGHKLNPKLDLQNWIMATANAGDMTVVGSFGITCRLLHPSYKLVYYSGCIGNFKKNVDIKDPTGGNIVEILSNVLKKVASTDFSDKLENVNLFSGGSDSSVLKTKMNEAAESVSKCLKWDSAGHGNMPFNNMPEKAISDALAFYFINWLMPSVWGMLVNEVCPSLGVYTRPTFSETTLTLSPFAPWVAPDEKGKNTIESNVIESIVLPTVEQSDIAGVHAYKPVDISDPIAPTTNAGGENRLRQQSFEKSSFATNSYVCIADKNTNIGQLLTVRTPELLQYIYEIAARDGKSTIKDLAAKMYQAWAKYTFLAHYRRNSIAELTCPFMTTYSNQEQIIPGDIVQVLSGPDSKSSVALVGTILSVTHSVSSSTASTRIIIGYCHSEKDPVIKESTNNPIFGKSAS